MTTTIKVEGHSNDSNIILSSTSASITDDNNNKSGSALSNTENMTIYNRANYPDVPFFPWKHFETSEVKAAKVALNNIPLRVNLPSWSFTHMKSPTSDSLPCGGAIQVCLALQQFTGCNLKLDLSTWDGTQSFWGFDNTPADASDGDFNFWVNTTRRFNQAPTYMIKTFEASSKATVLIYRAADQSIIDTAIADITMQDANGNVIVNAGHRATQALINANKKLLSSPCAIYDELITANLAGWDEAEHIILDKEGTLGANITDPKIYGPEWWAVMTGTDPGTHVSISTLISELSTAGLTPDFIFIGHDKVLQDTTVSGAVNSSIGYLDPTVGSLMAPGQLPVYINYRGTHKDNLKIIFEHFRSIGLLDMCLIPFAKMWGKISSIPSGRSDAAGVFADSAKAYEYTSSGIITVAPDTVSGVEFTLPSLLDCTSMLGSYEAAIRYGEFVGYDCNAAGFETLVAIPQPD
jgi:hypothetical protein